MNLEAVLTAGHPGGSVFATFADQDSGCVSYGVQDGAKRLFLKIGPADQLRRAADFHLNVQHHAIVAPLAYRERGERAALLYPWHDGQVLYHPTISRRVKRTDPDSPMFRFRAQPVAIIESALDTIFDAHLTVVAEGYVAIDFYDGAMLWDPVTTTMRLIDLDEYQPAHATVGTFAMTGSQRYMSPEERSVGALIDERTTVFTMGRTARLLLDAGDREDAWRGTAAQLDVVTLATRPVPGDRYASLAEFVAAWRAAR